MKSNSYITDPKTIISSSRFITFDIFDTVLTRAVPHPHDLHRILSSRIKERFGIKGFHRKRIYAERLVSIDCGGMCLYSLHDIYKKFASNENLPDDIVGQILDMEMGIELEMSVAFLPGVELLEIARKTNNFAGFVSDMYLPAATIRLMLENAGLYHENDRLWISCEAGASKSDGSLYSSVASDIESDISDWVHVGDNPDSDGNAAEALGITSLLLPPPIVSKRISKTCKKHPLLPADYDRLLSMGAAQHVSRIGQFRKLTDKQKIIWDTTATFVAPQILSFARWIVEQAIKDGVDEIWCLARDGQIIWKILSEKRNFLPHHDLKVRYMPASRQAYYFASLKELNEEAYKWIFSSPHLLDFKAMHSRLGGSDEIGDMLVDILGEDMRRSGYQFSHSQVALLQAKFQESEYSKRILWKASEQRTLFLDYLADKRVGNRFAVVDVGWKGSLQKSLIEILKGTYWEQTSYPGYYFGLHEAKHNQQSITMRGFNFSSAKVGDFEWKAMNLFELFFAADHPQYHGFRKTEEGHTEPYMLPEETWLDKMNWGVKEMQDAVLTFTDVIDLSKSGESIIGRVSSWELLVEFLKRPTLQEALVYSEWKVESLQGIDTSSNLGIDLTIGNLSEVLGNKTRSCHNWMPFVSASNPYYLLVLHRLLLQIRS